MKEECTLLDLIDDLDGLRQDLDALAAAAAALPADQYKHYAVISAIHNSMAARLQSAGHIAGELLPDPEEKKNKK